MKKLFSRGLLLFYLLTPAIFGVAQSTAKKNVRTIIIDPGHGGLDPGAPGSFSTEADVSLAVALKLGKALEKEFPDIKQVFTRKTDMLPGNKPNKDAANRYRATLANESGGDLFIAIHCNSAGRKPGGWYQRVVVGTETKYRKNKKGKKVAYKAKIYKNVWVENKVKGTETYIWAVNKNEAKINSMQHNHDYFGEIDSTSTLELPDPSDPAEKARMLIYTLNYFRKSLTLATLVEKQFVDSGRVSRGVKQRNDKGIWVLQATGMPSILIELGFITNKEEEEYLNSEKGQATMVENIMNALRAYIAGAEPKPVQKDEVKPKPF
jgi:N-acetylmuramoyl-L-alanine amidase